MTRYCSEQRVTLPLPPGTFRELGHRVVDMMSDWLEREQSDPVLEPVDGATLEALIREPLPRAGTPPAEVLDLFERNVARYARANGHPGYLAYVSASADPVGILADALASALNQNVTSWRSAPSAVAVERTVLQWLDELVGFGGGGHGALVSGGSAANLHAMACAINSAREKGRGLPELVVYASSETHFSVAKAARVLGLDAANVRRLAVDHRRRLPPATLARGIAGDRKRGLFPSCVCASAGTANTGAIDPLVEIAEVCRGEDAWFHVDGAYGAPAVMLSDYAWMREAFARADSISLDPHKWLYAPLDVACYLVRHPDRPRRCFAEQAEYAAVRETDPVQSHAFFDYSLELSRRFRALKVWMSLKVHGADAMARAIAANIDARRHLDALLAASDRLEGLGSDLSICCFRYRGSGLDEDRLNALNERLLERLLAEGAFLMSPTTLDGRFALRVCIVNFRTTEQHMAQLVADVERLGDELSGAGR